MVNVYRFIIIMKKSSVNVPTYISGHVEVQTESDTLKCFFFFFLQYGFLDNKQDMTQYHVNISLGQGHISS